MEWSPGQVVPLHVTGVIPISEEDVPVEPVAGPADSNFALVRRWRDAAPKPVAGDVTPPTMTPVQVKTTVGNDQVTSEVISERVFSFSYKFLYK